jgi:23S rRNA (uracil1939-C5)-methyltransferase
MNNKPNTLSIKIEKPVFGGEFIGRLLDGRPAFVPYVLPDEDVKILIKQDKKGFARATLISVENVSNKRIAPLCKFFTKCGGCHYQHMDYSEQLLLKQLVVVEQFSRIQGFDISKLKHIIPADDPFHYRNNIQFSITKEGFLGFQASGTNQIIPIDECYLPEEQIKQAWNLLDMELFPGLKKIHIRVGIQDETMIIIESENYSDLPSLELNVPISVVHLSKAGKIVMAGDDHLVYQVKNQYFHVSAESFFQVNTSQAEKMIDIVCDYLPSKGKSILELYSGVGLFTKFFADRFDQVFAVEESPSACDDFAINLDEFDHINLYIGSVKDIVPYLDLNPETILVDPPRAGLDSNILETLLSMDAQIIVYVSCDISTLARDLKRILDRGYQLEEITAIDMFPQTYHIECVVKITKVKR